MCFRDITGSRVSDLTGLDGRPEFEGYGRICKDVFFGHVSRFRVKYWQESWGYQATSVTFSRGGGGHKRPLICQC